MLSKNNFDEKLKQMNKKVISFRLESLQSVQLPF